MYKCSKIENSIIIRNLVDITKSQQLKNIDYISTTHTLYKEYNPLMQFWNKISRAKLVTFAEPSDASE